MCRYAFKRYKSTYVCFKCQVGFKRRNLFDVDADNANTLLNKAVQDGNRIHENKDAKCPNCGGEAFDVGRDLRLPKKEEDEQWRCIKYLVDNKYNIYSCGCQGIGFVPHKMTDAIELVKNDALKDKKYTYEQALQNKQEALAKKRKKNAEALKTKLLLRKVKKEVK